MKLNVSCENGSYDVILGRSILSNLLNIIKF